MKHRTWNCRTPECMIEHTDIQQRCDWCGTMRKDNTPKKWRDRTWGWEKDYYGKTTFNDEYDREQPKSWSIW